VPPVRDEESETQRKAHAKRVRETRRSTQGVTLEDLKSAEQLVKKKQQQENQQRTSELQQLVASQQQEQLKKYSPTTVPSVSVQQPSSGSSSAASSITALPTSTSIAAAAAAVNSGSTSSIASNASLTGDSTERHERRPSWRLRLDTSDKNKVGLTSHYIHTRHPLFSISASTLKLHVGCYLIGF
jgi:protein phosphatase 1 regulatory subunit 12A